MSETKFTPGPWRPDFEDFTSADDVSVQAGGAIIADVLGADSFPCLDEDDTPQFDEGQRANANLIAAAPELYEALLVAQDTLSRFGCHLGIVGNALAKARGEA